MTGPKVPMGDTQRRDDEEPGWFPGWVSLAFVVFSISYGVKYDQLRNSRRYSVYASIDQTDRTAPEGNRIHCGSGM
jgi:hypothetical protein